MENETAPHVPSNKTIGRIFVYVGIVLLFGAFFNQSCTMMNSTEPGVFEVGAVLTFAGFFGVALFARHVFLFVTSKLNQGS